MDGIVVRVGARMSEVCRKRFHDLPTTIFFFHFAQISCLRIQCGMGKIRSQELWHLIYFQISARTVIRLSWKFHRIFLAHVPKRLLTWTNKVVRGNHNYLAPSRKIYDSIIRSTILKHYLINNTWKWLSTRKTPKYQIPVFFPQNRLQPLKSPMCDGELRCDSLKEFCWIDRIS